MRRTTLSVAIAAAAFLASTKPASAGFYLLANVNIKTMGCHTNLPPADASISPTCFITIDQDPSASPARCRNNRSLRWDATTPSGRSTLAVLQGAFLAERPVDIYVSDKDCSVQPDHPTFGAVDVK